MTTRIAIVVAFALCGASQVLAATDSLDLVKHAVSEAVKKEKPWGKPMAELLAEIKAQRDPTLKMTFGFSGDEAGARNLYQISGDFEAARGAYPRRFRFLTGTQLTYKNNTLEEQVRTILFNYDYHLRSALESYAFVERFTDTYMGIDDRYEIGGGLKLEWESIHLTRAGERLRNTLDSLQDPRKRDLILADLDASVEGPLRQLGSDPYLRVAVRKRHTRVALGLAGTLMTELEKASVETLVDTLDATHTSVMSVGRTSTKVELPSETQLRAVVRPSIEVRPTSQLTLRGLVYVKYPLRNQRRDDRLDYRVDGQVTSTLQLEPDEGGQEKVALVWEVRENYDNTPPSIPAEMQSTEVAKGLRFRRTTNEKKHMSTTFKISVAW